MARSSEARQARKQLEKEQARTLTRVASAKVSDPEWGQRVDAAWKRLTQNEEDGELLKAFEALLKEKNLL